MKKILWGLAILLGSFPQAIALVDESLLAQGGAVRAAMVEMPSYVVSETRVLPDIEKWYYVKVPALVLTRDNRDIVVPGYEILSNLSKKQSVVLVEDLQLRQFAAAYLWPQLAQALHRMPIYVQVDINQQQGAPLPITGELTSWAGEPITATHVQTSSNYFHSYQYAVRSNTHALFAEENGLTTQNYDFEEMPHLDSEAEADEFKLMNRQMETERRAVTIKPLPDGFVIMAMNGGPLAGLVRAGDPRTESERPSEKHFAATLSYHTSLFALHSLPQKIPPWFKRGLSNLLGCTQVSNTEIQFALVREPSVRQTMPELAEILMKKEGFSHEESLLASAFVHYGLYGDNGVHRSRFIRLVELLAQDEQPTEALFNTVFDVSMKEMQALLETYTCSFSADNYTRGRGSIPSMPAFEIREATQAEVAKIKAEVFVALVNPAKALDELRIAYWRGERAPDMLALLASLEQLIGSKFRAEKIVRSLLGLPSPPPQTYIVAARLILQDRLQKPDAGKISTDEATKLFELLGHAVASGLKTEDLCSALAEIVTQSSGEVPSEIADFLREAMKRYPRNSGIAAAVSQSTK